MTTYRWTSTETQLRKSCVNPSQKLWTQTNRKMCILRMFSGSETERNTTSIKKGCGVGHAWKLEFIQCAQAPIGLTFCACRFTRRAPGFSCACLLAGEQQCPAYFFRDLGLAHSPFAATTAFQYPWYVAQTAQTAKTEWLRWQPVPRLSLLGRFQLRLPLKQPPGHHFLCPGLPVALSVESCGQPRIVHHCIPRHLSCKNGAGCPVVLF